MRPPVFDPSRPVHSFDFVTAENGAECSRCGTYSWGAGLPSGVADDAICPVPPRGEVTYRRHCTDCGVPLPKYLLNGSLDTSPRCSAHAF